LNELKVFENPTFGQVRTIEIDNEPCFVGKDVAEALGYSNTRDALDRHVEKEDKNTVVNPDGNRGNPNMTIINESGLYCLILSSKLPGAKEFKHWITHDVIPSIRKTGAYMTQETLEAAILNPDYLLQVVTALKEETDKRKALEVVNATLTVDKAILQPKADYFDELVERGLLTNFRETAKQLGIPPKKFVNWLIEHKYLYRDKKGKLLAYENKNNGLFELKECVNERTQWAGVQTLVTPKGRETFRLLCQGLAS
jgi:prophage antirepressor-like protein